MVHDRPVCAREAAPQACRRLEVETLRDADQVDVGAIDGNKLREGSPAGEPRLELPFAHLVLPATAGVAVTAGAHEWHGDQVPGGPVAHRGAHLSDPTRELVTGHVGEANVGSCPIQPCQSLRHRPVAATSMIAPAAGWHAGSAAVISRGSCWKWS